ncbi:MAG TPA: pilus assembly protein PilO [Desulfobulbaceae bacterium]|nr:pilus assembly protein PilO [Desulfobulbaceae bacterium]
MARKEKPVSEFNRFIDTRYIPMAPLSKFAMALLLLVLPVIVYIVFSCRPYLTEKEELAKRKITLESELVTLRSQTGRLQQWERKFAEAQEMFNGKAALLPETEEIPKLLKEISSLGAAAGLDFLSFKPMPALPKDFYAEIPISISLKGTYHSIGHFFDTVSRLERIVSVGDLQMSGPTRENHEMILRADCQLLTYRYGNEEISKLRMSAGDPTKK